MLRTLDCIMIHADINNTQEGQLSVMVKIRMTTTRLDNLQLVGIIT